MENLTAKNAIEAMHKTSEKFSQDLRETMKDAGVMDEYIKKADAVKLCNEYSEYSFDNCDFIGASDFERLQNDIEQLPTADVVEVKHGEWKKIECGTICTNCNRVYDNDFEFSYKQINEYFKRCPECGAKMDVSILEITTERKDA